MNHETLFTNMMKELKEISLSFRKKYKIPTSLENLSEQQDMLEIHGQEMAIAAYEEVVDKYTDLEAKEFQQMQAYYNQLAREKTYD